MIRSVLFCIFSTSLVSVFLMTIGYSQDIPEVISVNTSNKPSQSSGLLHEFLSQVIDRPLDFKEFPDFEKSYKTLEVKLRQMLKTTDKGPIHFVLLDNSTPNAFFVRSIKSNERILAVNVGIFKYLKNDDELLYLIGHELSHGASDIEKIVEKYHKAGENFKAKLLGKFVEYESDFKSIVERVRKVNGNTHAGYEFCYRLQGDVFSNVSISHGANTARLTAMNVASTALARERGVNLKPEGEYTHNIVTDKITRNFDDTLKKIKKHEVQKIQNRINNLIQGESSKAQEAYRQIKILKGDKYWLDKISGKDEVILKNAFAQEARERLKEIEKHLQRIDNDYYSKLDGINFELQKNLHQSYEKFRKEVLPDDEIKKLTGHQRMMLFKEDRRPATSASISAVRKWDDFINSYKLSREGELRELLEKFSILNLGQHGQEGQGGIKLIRLLLNSKSKNKKILDMVYNEIHNGIKNDGSGVLEKYGGFEFGREHRQGKHWLLGYDHEYLNEFYHQYREIDLEGADKKVKELISSGLEQRKFLFSSHDYSENAFRDFIGFHGNEMIITLKDKEKIFDELFVDRLFKILLEDGITEEVPVSSLKKVMANVNSILKMASVGKEDELYIRKKQEWFIQQYARKIDNGITSREYFKVLHSIDLPIVKQGGVVEKFENINEFKKFLQKIPKKELETLNFNFSFLQKLGGSNEEFFELLADELGVDKIKKFLDQKPLMIEDYYNWILKKKPQYSEQLREYILSHKAYGNQFNTKAEKKGFEKLKSFLKVEKKNAIKRLMKHSSHVDSFEKFTDAIVEFKKLYGGDFEDEIRKMLDDFLPKDGWARFKAFSRFYQEYKPHFISTYDGYPQLIVNIIDNLPDNPRAALQKLSEVYDVVNKVLKPGMDMVEKYNYFFPEKVMEILSHPSISEILSLKEAAHYYELFMNSTSDLKLISDMDNIPFISKNGEQHLVDLIIQKLKKNKNIKLPSPFNQTDIIKKLRFQEDQNFIAMRQMQEKFNIEYRALQLKKQKTPITNSGQQRKLIQDMNTTIKLQFGENPSTAKHQIIQDVGRLMQTNEIETGLLYEGTYSLKNLQDDVRLLAADSVHLAVSQVDNLDDKFELLKYYIGKQDELSQRLLSKIELPEQYFGLNDDKMKRAVVAKSKRYLAEMNVVFRNLFGIQALLEGPDGLLASEIHKEKIIHLILGEHANDKVIREFFETYLSVLPSSERKMIMGHMLSSMIDVRTVGRLRLGDIFNAMGPFGARVAQFLRTSELVSDNLKKELDGFFNYAIPPDRRDIIEGCKKIFGKNFKNMEVRELAGSGSLNYVVKIQVYNKDKKGYEQLALRIQKDFVEGKIRNENRNWKNALVKLKKSKNVQIREFASVLDTAREFTMRFLKRGGRELNLQKEVATYKIAKESYLKDINENTGFKVEPSKPREDMTKLIKKKFRQKAAIYEFVDFVSLSEIKDIGLRERLVSQLMETELDGILKKGIFDPDGHPGNWLIDVENKRLIRTDYAQITLKQIDETYRESFRKTLALLVVPDPKDMVVDEIADQMKNHFKLSRKIDNIEEIIKTILRQSEYRKEENTIKRYFHVRTELGKKLKSKYPRMKINFVDEIREMLGAISRLNIYRDYLPKRQFQKIAMKKIGTTIPTIIRSTKKVNIFKKLIRDKLDIIKKSKFGCLKKELRKILTLPEK